ncbi:hypothetical protein [Glaciimonas immobilis]|uniref:Uncharacterized protein n=1 Tax=Glaciimonas immobilis TaxID=728004 RepID=A0A840RSC2_9BURK|nr:hypothetical protein [Glaciimonas immobilis]KAF3996854.1 hypothetical protein HAV38_16850 [Glaciimonas immobilis]MBB5199594.1 hypothetical protein [Glaciimonas immobilis]
MNDLPVPPSNTLDPTLHASSDEADNPLEKTTQEPRLWRDVGWTARVIKNVDDEGWAVEMIKDGEPEPALVGPWTMGRDKKNPKPLDTNAFNTLVKTASEVLRRHEQQLHAMLHKEVVVATDSATVNVTLDIVPDDDFPYAVLTAHDEDGNQLAQVQVRSTFVLTKSSANAWIETDFRKPA